MAAQVVRLDGKIVVITGGNTGIGKETAIDLATRGATVVIGCRNEEKARAAVEDIKRQSCSEQVDFIKLDLASLSSVKQFADDFLAKYEKLHILINNAGIMACPYQKTQDGFEMQIGVNHFGHFVLTKHLLQRILDTGPGRIINLSSLYHERGTINFDDINSEKSYGNWQAYGQSKLANILFTKELHRRLQGTQVTTYAVHPGYVDTELARDVTCESIFLSICCFCIKKTPRDGAQTSIYCAIAEGIENESGNYFADCRVTRSSRKSQNMDDAKRLWELSEELTNCKYEII